ELVEGAVVGQEALLHERLQLAPAADGARVVEVAVEMRRADEERDAVRCARDLLERALGGSEEARPEEEVLRRVAGDGELGEDDDLGAGVLRGLEPVEDERAVSVQVADRGVDLGEREPHRFETTRRKPLAAVSAAAG